MTQRRLAAQNRNDAVSSRRDYQDIHEVNSTRLIGQPNIAVLVFRPDPHDGGHGLLGAGGYIHPSAECQMTLSFGSISKTFQLKPNWNRFGLALPPGRTVMSEVSASFFPPLPHLDVWGITTGSINLPEGVRDLNASEISANHLAPESFFLSHKEVSIGDLDIDGSDHLALSAGTPIMLKKCAYCGRLLPLDPDRPSALAFHKHRSKISGHQNECRACKALRINDWFNPKRTADQFHESSTINRERKLFLQEPQILQEIKDKEGRGLKSIVWERFGRACFNCGKLLALDEVQLDHTRPFAYLWPIDEYATCLCGECNNHKKDRFPADFYSQEKLNRLADITGLPIEDLSRREICRPQLDRVVAGIELFANEWHPRTFNAVARKVREFMPEVDLFAILKEKSPSTHDSLQAALKDRPAAIGSEDDADTVLFEDS